MRTTAVAENQVVIPSSVAIDSHASACQRRAGPASVDVFVIDLAARSRTTIGRGSGPRWPGSDAQLEEALTAPLAGIEDDRKPAGGLGSNAGTKGEAGCSELRAPLSPHGRGVVTGLEPPAATDAPGLDLGELGRRPAVRSGREPRREVTETPLGNHDRVDPGRKACRYVLVRQDHLLHHSILAELEA